MRLLELGLERILFSPVTDDPENGGLAVPLDDGQGEFDVDPFSRFRQSLESDTGFDESLPLQALRVRAEGITHLRGDKHRQVDLRRFDFFAGIAEQLLELRVREDDPGTPAHVDRIPGLLEELTEPRLALPEFSFAEDSLRDVRADNPHVIADGKGFHIKVNNAELGWEHDSLESHPFSFLKDFSVFIHSLRTLETGSGSGQFEEVFSDYAFYRDIISLQDGRIHINNIILAINNQKRTACGVPEVNKEFLPVLYRITHNLVSTIA